MSDTTSMGMIVVDGAVDMARDSESDSALGARICEGGLIQFSVFCRRALMSHVMVEMVEVRKMRK